MGVVHSGVDEKEQRSCPICCQHTTHCLSPLCDKSITPLQDFLIVRRCIMFVVSCLGGVIMWWGETTRIGDVRFCFVCFVVVNIIMPRGHSKRAGWV